MADLVITSAQIVEWRDKFDAPAGAANLGVASVIFDANGAVIKSNAGAAGTAIFQGIATTPNIKRAGQTTTVVRDGLLDVGAALDALAYGAPVYMSNTAGALADTAGTVSVLVGNVVPGYANLTPDKLLRIRKP